MRKVKVKKHFSLLVLAVGIALATSCGSFIRTSLYLSGAESYYKYGNYERAIEYYDKVIALNENLDEAYNGKAKCLEALGEYEKSLEYCDKALEQNNNMADAYNTKGDALSSLSRFEEALENYKKAFELEPDESLCANNIAYTFNCLEKYEDALKYSEKAIKLNKNNDSAYINKGYALEGLGKTSEALDCYNKSAEINPSNPICFYNKGNLLESLGKSEKAIDCFDKALELDPNDLNALNSKGDSLNSLGEFEKAIDCFEQAIEVDPSYVDAYTNKIYCLYYQKKFSKCIEFSNQALDLFQDNQDIPWYIGDCYSALLDSDKAIEYYKKALEINPESTSLIVSICWEYYSLQDYDKAREYLGKAKDISPNDEGVLYLESQLKKQDLPEAERIVDFVKENYLYIDKVNNFEKLAEQFKAKNKVNIDDISQFIESVRLRDDMFTFFIYGDEYDLMKQEETVSQVESKVLESNIHYIKIKSFTESVSWEFKDIIDRIESHEDKVLVIDLRDNTGGVTSSSTDILNYLLPECTTSYIVYRNGSMYPYYSDKSFIKFKKILVLVNEYSASSSEILTLGLKKYLNNVVIIGHTTVGKGVGQLVYEDKAKKYMIYLVSFYWNVMEENIMEKRITPDVYVKGSDDSSYMKEIKRQAS